MPKTILSRRIWFSTILTVFLCGCHLLPRNQIVYQQEYYTDQPADVFVSPEFHRLQPKRIVLMIPKSQENHYELNARVVDAIRRNLVRQGLFDVVLNAGVCDVTLDAIKQGTFDERHLWEVSKQYNADGILLCESFAFSAYEPLKLGCSLTFVDTRESIVTLYANGVWDTARTNVFNKFRQHVCQTHKCKEYAAGLFLKSPTEFIEFVSVDLTNFLDSIIRPTPNETSSLNAELQTQYPDHLDSTHY